MTDKVGVLASGEGSTYEALWWAIHHGAIEDTEIAYIVSNRSSGRLWSRARKLGTPILHVSNMTEETCTVPQTDGADAKGTISYEVSDRLVELARQHEIKMYVALGYMKRIVGRVLDEVPILNLHQGPLGPDKVTAGLAGADAQQYILRTSRDYSGPTMHWVSSELGHDGLPVYDDGQEVGHEPVAVTRKMREEWERTGSAQLLEEEVRYMEKIWVPHWTRDALDQL